MTYKLLELGYDVIGTVQGLASGKFDFLKEAKFHPRSPQHLQLVDVDLLQSDQWPALCEKVEYILHIASPFPWTPPTTEEEIIRPAVEGTENVLRAAIQSKKVKRVVLTSSVASVQDGHPKELYEQEHMFNEDDWSVVENQFGYQKSKTLAELRAWEMVKDTQVELVTICPGLIIGPVFNAVQTSSTSSIIIKDLLMRKYPFAAPMGLALADVRDVADAHIRAMQLPSNTVAGRRYLINSGCMSWQFVGQILQDEFSQFGFSPSQVPAPEWFFHLYSNVDKALYELRDQIGHIRHVSNDRMVYELRMAPRDIKSSVIDHVYSLMNVGVVPRRIPSVYTKLYNGLTDLFSRGPLPKQDKQITA